ncbi:hypothetical protein CALVIDRAFT_347395 [Calocera viscosa TUFC12733]|uniref:Uncharacterized protein n=1 Tax=Calocera viscosa (strain TUFC12733) TaxID=1330018 RepID=A0A167H851_CALVF|nr:hypothetical protein CALVIDRAFT_347395 [Calocera viscosa TUFC12733]
MSAPISQSTSDLKPAGPLGTSAVPAPPTKEHQPSTSVTKRPKDSSAWYTYWVGLLAQLVLILGVGWLGASELVHGLVLVLLNGGNWRGTEWSEAGCERRARGFRDGRGGPRGWSLVVVS